MRKLEWFELIQSGIWIVVVLVIAGAGRLDWAILVLLVWILWVLSKIERKER